MNYVKVEEFSILWSNAPAEVRGRCSQRSADRHVTDNGERFCATIIGSSKQNDSCETSGTSPWRAADGGSYIVDKSLAMCFESADCCYSGWCPAIGRSTILNAQPTIYSLHIEQVANMPKPNAPACQANLPGMRNLLCKRPEIYICQRNDVANWDVAMSIGNRWYFVIFDTVLQRKKIQSASRIFFATVTGRVFYYLKNETGPTWWSLPDQTFCVL